MTLIGNTTVARSFYKIKNNDRLKKNLSTLKKYVNEPNS